MNASLPSKQFGGKYTAWGVEMRGYSWLFAGVIVFGAMSCSGSTRDKDGCTTDSNCKGARVCVDGVCVDDASPDAGAADVGGDVGSVGPECEAGASRITIDMCGLNARGRFQESCDGGVWLLVGECDDPDVCMDESVGTGSTSCGLNQRGVLGQLCVAGQWEDSTECEDHDVCADATREAGETVCGLNGRSVFDRECVAGAWQDTADCPDADVCVDGMSAAGQTACGLNGRGLLGAQCVIGQWVDTSTCQDIDVCVDQSTQVGSTSCGAGGYLEQLCTLGAWVNTATCVGGSADSDGDGVVDNVDNCVGVPNPNQSDSNGDGVGDACTWDLAEDFSTVANPNGPWTFGWSTTRAGALTNYPSLVPANGIDFWQRPSNRDPNVTHNPASSAIATFNATWPAGAVAYHPGQTGQHSVVRWAAPYAGDYRIVGFWEGLNPASGCTGCPTTTDVAILFKAVTLLDAGVNISGFGNMTPFDLTITASAGDEVRFTVGYGNSNYTSDTTRIEARILLEP